MTAYCLRKYRLKWNGLSGYSKSQFSKKSNKVFPHLYSNIVPIPPHLHVIEENLISELDSLEKQERKLLIEKKRLHDTLDQLQSKVDIISDRKSRLLAEMERNIISKQQNRKSESSYKLFSVVTWGSSWTDGLVFAVMAESEVWAEDLVRQWLNSNGRGNHKIDKVLALVSRDVRAIVNVGAKLLDV
jgi:hypothetical protein